MSVTTFSLKEAVRTGLAHAPRSFQSLFLWFALVVVTIYARASFVLASWQGDGLVMFVVFQIRC